jgi:hypothetical protein
MNKINTGGTAFPFPAYTYPNGEIIYGEFGMTLRDYFAAKALQGYMVGLKPAQDIGPDMQDRIAEGMYSMADAMLKAREA